MKELQVEKQLPVVQTNFEEVKASLQSEINKYKGIVVIEENLKDCKATQKELAGLRIKLDTHRKDIKKSLEAPIKEFEAKCKELVGMIADVESPIKDGINVFDDKRREEKKNKALEFIKEAITAHSLEEKYSSQLVVEDKYLTLNGSIKAIREDVEAKAISLKAQQEAEKAHIALLKAAIESTLELVNRDLKTPLKPEDFEKFIDLGWDIKSIDREIKSRAELVKEAEKPKEIPKEEPKQEVNLPVDLTPQKPTKPNTEVPKFLINMVVTDTRERMAALSKFLKDNNYKYDILENKRV